VGTALCAFAHPTDSGWPKRAVVAERARFLTLRVEPLGSLRTAPGLLVPAPFHPEFPMAKSTTIKVKLVSSADTGFYYVTKKNSRTQTDKLVKKKYDPVARKHVEFREAKIK
jgi:large subunit ribosomal protein L33